MVSFYYLFKEYRRKSKVRGDSMRPKLSITAVGDFLHQRMLPIGYDGFQEVKAFIERGDARFFNLETVFPDESCYGNQFYGGAYLRDDEKACLSDARAFGLNITAFANNHTLDYSYGGLLRTLDAVNAAGFPNSGVGRNLDEAASAGFLSTKNGSFGLIGVVSTMGNVAAIAGKQSRRVLGRPGVNGLRISDKIVVPEEYFKVLKDIDDNTSVNAQVTISRSEGFTPPLPEGLLPMQASLFEKGDTLRYETHPNEVDMERIVYNIKNARQLCDYVAVSLHSHEVGAKNKEVPGQFFTEFAHRCIDAGATAVLGHGPHIIRPLEIYKGCPIFYSMGNFVFQDLTEFHPEDMYEKYHVTSDMSVSDLNNIRTANNTRGLLCNRFVLEAIIPYIEVDNDVVTKIELFPISLGAELETWQMGLPRPGFGRGILERLQVMSEPYGTKITIREDGIGVVEL